MIKNVILLKLYISIFLEQTNFKDDLLEYKYLCCSNNYQQKFDKKLEEKLCNNLNFLTATIVSLFYCCEKVFILTNI